MRRRIGIVGTAAMIGCLLYGSLIFAENNNLAANGSFEELVDGKPAHWLTSAWDKNGSTTFKTEEGAGYSGTHYVSITNQSESDSRYIQEVRVKENSIYRLSGWIKTENVPVTSKGANLSVEGKTETSPDVKGTTDWTYTELFVATGQGVGSFKATLGLGGYGQLTKGKAYFDEFRVDEVQAVPAGAVVTYLGNAQNKGQSQNAAQQYAPAVLKKGPSSMLWILLGLEAAVIGWGVSRYFSMRGTNSIKGVEGERERKRSRK